MINDYRVVVIIPAINEEESLPKVIKDIPNYVDETIVVDNGSTDKTIAVAKQAGATVLKESERGYGAACLKAIDYIKDKYFDIIVFLDGDYSDFPEEMDLLLKPIIEEKIGIKQRRLGLNFELEFIYRK